jgi:hypothetical protein
LGLQAQILIVLNNNNYFWYSFGGVYIQISFCEIKKRDVPVTAPGRAIGLSMSMAL